ncbi:MAG: UDP-glucose 4-epimerase GalE [Alphaproteobacteria bacterium]|nr:MAG: UDP-glucose 4-epimerase GalE [Alphaproteobacteria bacterium]
MAVLVTGGAGYIGSHAVYALRDAGYEVIVLDNLSTGHQKVLPTDVTFVQGDVADIACLDKVFTAHAISTVMHFAGSVIVEESIHNPEKYYQNNTHASRILIDACRHHRIPNFIFSSTAAVYGHASTMTVDETHHPHPETPYAESKLQTETSLCEASQAHGLNVTVLRYFNVAGADPNGRTGQLMINATHLIKVACEVAAGKRPELTIFGVDYDTPDGTAIRDFIHVSDLADMHVCVLKDRESYQGKGAYDVYNCGYGKGTSVREVITALDSLTEWPLVVREAPRRAGDLGAVVADVRKFQQKFAWQPQYNDLYKILQSTLSWEYSID